MQYEELLIFCYASCQNGQSWIRKFVIPRFKTVGQYTIPYVMNLNTSLKLGNLICAHADFAKFI